jgi:hypothetical protein
MKIYIPLNFFEMAQFLNCKQKRELFCKHNAMQKDLYDSFELCRMSMKRSRSDSELPLSLLLLHWLFFKRKA